MDPLEFLLSLEVLGMKFGLENMRTLCTALDHPEQAFRSVIVAGTNGKGSVTAMVSAALAEAGHRVARYTSPHLQRLEERFVIQEHDVATIDLIDAAGRVQTAVERLLESRTLAQPPTFFECTTAVAFELFRRARVDLAVLEVGLGGRLDATNVVSPLVAAITSIALDHQAQLGNTIREVAREKAGIVKPGIPVVVGPVPAEADRVIEDVCVEHGARLVRVGRDVRVESSLAEGRTLVTVHTPHRLLKNVPLALQGHHQAANAATAVGILDELRLLGIDADDRVVTAGLRVTRWPGRLERFAWRGRDVMLDAAHNPAGARALAEYLRDAGWTGATLLFGAMRDKDVEGMLGALLPISGALICTTPANPRALPGRDVAALAASLLDRPAVVEVVDDPAAALIRAAAFDRPIVAAGSIFLIGPLRGILR